MEADNENNGDNGGNQNARVVGDDDESIPPDPLQPLITSFLERGRRPKFDPSKYPPPKENRASLKKDDDSSKDNSEISLSPFDVASDDYSGEDDLQVNVYALVMA